MRIYHPKAKQTNNSQTRKCTFAESHQCPNTSIPKHNIFVRFQACCALKIFKETFIAVTRFCSPIFGSRFCRNRCTNSESVFLSLFLLSYHSPTSDAHAVSHRGSSKPTLGFCFGRRGAEITQRFCSPIFGSRFCRNRCTNSESVFLSLAPILSFTHLRCSCTFLSWLQ